jgi:hypothetical protein
MRRMRPAKRGGSFRSLHSQRSRRCRISFATASMTHFNFPFPMLGETGKISDCSLSDFYNEAEIDYLQTMQHRAEGGQARADEVIDA